MPLTRKTHYNPCFWTAFWNQDYYEAILSNTINNLNCRSQYVFSLNLRSNMIRSTIVENVFYENNLGISRSNSNDIVGFIKDTLPYKSNKYKKGFDYCKTHSFTISSGLENIFTTMEDTVYKPMINIIKREEILDHNDKIVISAFIYFHLVRNPSFINNLFNNLRGGGISKIENFRILKNILSKPKDLGRFISTLIYFQWVTYKLNKHTFPLSDSPLIYNGNIFVPISPRLLVEINPGISGDSDKVIKYFDITEAKYNEFRSKTIEATYREIVFCDKSTLTNWQNTFDYQKRLIILTQT